jgi:prepilin-type N-terminal cleavage/methylation domain-containing protein
MKEHRKRGFTIIELLVVVSIIALLIGILLPAIGKARDSARLSQSQSNIRNLVVAHNTYSAEWNDNQWTIGPHNLATYGSNHASAVQGYMQSFKKGSYFDMGIEIGYAGGQMPGQYFLVNWSGTFPLFMPIGLGESKNPQWGYFKMMNLASFSNYLSGRYYDPVLYAPKDRAVIASIGECMDVPGACVVEGPWTPRFTSYIISPAAHFSPDVMTTDFWDNNSTVFNHPGSLRTPSMSQARYSDLKSMITEHHWLQNNRRDCHPSFPGGQYDGCQPYYFNLAAVSQPQTAFYDGHIAGMGMREAWLAHRRAQQQGDSGLWLNEEEDDMPGGFASDPVKGYFENYSFPTGNPASAANIDVSPHILTRDGILGRDVGAGG